MPPTMYLSPRLPRDRSPFLTTPDRLAHEAPQHAPKTLAMSSSNQRNRIKLPSLEYIHEDIVTCSYPESRHQALKLS